MTPNDRADFGPKIDRVQRTALIVGVVAIVLCAVGLFLEPKEFFESYLFAYIFWIGLALGSLGVVMLQHMSGGNWGYIIRRLLESGTRTLPLMALLVIPILAGIPKLYYWANPESLHEHAIAAKQGWLNIPWFIIRTVIYFAIWLFLTYLLNRRSKERARLGKVSGPGLVVFVFSVSLAVVDWVMSLQPEWYSTIFGFIMICGQALSILCFSVAVLVLLSDREPLASTLTPQHLHDLGNLMLAFTMLWAYMSFSQLLIIWAGNLPEEIPYYTRRLYTPWGWVAVTVLIFHFVVPFILLLMRDIKRRGRLISKFAVALLVVRTIDVFWMVKPAFHPEGFSISWLDFAAIAGIGGIWIAMFCRELKTRSLLPV